MIRYRKSGPGRITRTVAPEPPFGVAAFVEPYGFPRGNFVALDYCRLIGTTAGRAEVAVCEVPGELTLFDAPILIDTTESAELVYRRGEEWHRIAREQQLPVIQLISATSGTPNLEPSAGSLVVLCGWPPYLRQIEKSAQSLFRAGWRWGLAIPVLFPATTELALLERLAAIAANHRADFLLGIRFDLDPAARHALAAAYPTDDEAYSTLFDEGAEALAVATERHIAALAAERGLRDSILTPDRERRTNWNAAVLTALAGYRLFAMREDLELGWEFLRSSRRIATLEKPLSTIAAAASLSIVEGLQPQLVEALEQWLETGTAALFEGIDRHWHLRRDYRR